jgi:hypothetical protein
MLDFKQFVKSPSTSVSGFALGGTITGGNTVISKQVTSGAGTDKLEIRLANKALKGQTCLLFYTKANGDLTIGTTGVKVDDFALAVINNSQLVPAEIIAAELFNYPLTGSSKFGNIMFRIRFDKAINTTPSELANIVKIYIDSDKEIT